ncbi:MAG: RNA polymerase sigma-70 factor [Bacteroidales bacterium]|nr:RNA polymerase sigma-70 factor [Bacteroidales bacterium]
MTENSDKKISEGYDHIRYLKYFKNEFQKYYESLCAYAFHFLKNKELSEDIVQDVFTDLWKKRMNLNCTLSLKPLLYKCTHDKAINYLKSSYCINRENFDYDTKVNELENIAERIVSKETDSEIDCQFMLSQIRTCINRLPPQCRRVFKTSRESNMTNKEIAAELKISTKAVEKQITKALSIIRQQLSKEGFLFFIFYCLINKI